MIINGLNSCLIILGRVIFSFYKEMGIPISIFVAKDLETDRKVGMRTRIKEFRARHDLTQVDLTRMVNVRRETIVFLEKGEYNPPLKLAAKISYQFHEPIEVVFLFDSDELH